MRRVDIAEVDSVWVERTENADGFWKRHCKVVPSKATCLLSAYELHRAGGGKLADLQAARREATPVGQSWASGLARLITEVCRAASPSQRPRKCSARTHGASPGPSWRTAQQVSRLSVAQHSMSAACLSLPLSRKSMSNTMAHFQPDRGVPFSLTSSFSTCKVLTASTFGAKTSRSADHCPCPAGPPPPPVALGGRRADSHSSRSAGPVWVTQSPLL